MKALKQSSIALSCQAQEDAILECLRCDSSLSIKEIQEYGRRFGWLNDLFTTKSGGFSGIGWSLFQWRDRIGRALKRLIKKGLAKQSTKGCPARYRSKGQTKYWRELDYEYFDWLRKIVNPVVSKDLDHGISFGFVVSEGGGLHSKSNPNDNLGYGLFMPEGYCIIYRNKGIHLLYRNYIEMTAVEFKLLHSALNLFKCKSDPICIATHPNPIIRNLGAVLLRA